MYFKQKRRLAYGLLLISVVVILILLGLSTVGRGEEEEGGKKTAQLLSKKESDEEHGNQGGGLDIDFAYNRLYVTESKTVPPSLSLYMILMNANTFQSQSF